MHHLDLFSGIGGFALATEMVWDDVEHVFCDNDLFCQAILKKHWPHSPIYGDIQSLTANAEFKRLEGKAGKELQSAQFAEGNTEVHLLTGGFPCQPFSQAGRRRGTQDNRHLWPQMLRVIQEFHPRWIIGENVGGLVTWERGLVLQQICLDLEGEGYAVHLNISRTASKYSRSTTIFRSFIFSDISANIPVGSRCIFFYFSSPTPLCAAPSTPCRRPSANLSSSGAYSTASQIPRWVSSLRNHYTVFLLLR